MSTTFDIYDRASPSTANGVPDWRIDPGAYVEAITFRKETSKIKAYWSEEASMIRISGDRMNMTVIGRTMEQCIISTAFYFGRRE